MNTTLKYAGVVALVIAIIALFTPVRQSIVPSFSGVTNYDSLTLGENLIVGGTSTFTGDPTFNGGTLTVTTANTATSTVIAGCYQFYATSTATALKFQASTTPGIMYSQYGTCPNL